MFGSESLSHIADNPRRPSRLSLLQRPQKRVADNLHIINLSVKILTVVVQAATLGLPVGNVIPKFNLAEQDELVEVARSHLVLAAERA